MPLPRQMDPSIRGRALHMSRVVCQGTAKDPYTTLGVGRGASTDEIKKAFRHLAKKYHPDINKDEGSQQKMAEITRWAYTRGGCGVCRSGCLSVRLRVCSAYEMLSDPKKRDFYDKTGGRAQRHPWHGMAECVHGDWIDPSE